MNTTKQYKLPKDFAEKWVAALRSEDYRQVKYTLVDDGGYCCLGVAGKLCGVLHNSMIRSNDLFSISEVQRGKIPKQFFLTRLQTGITDIQSVVAGMNDDGATFPEIASWIEANVEFI